MRIEELFELNVEEDFVSIEEISDTPKIKMANEDFFTCHLTIGWELGKASKTNEQCCF